MDEPLSNLDAKLRVQMRTEITKLHQRLQTTFIYVTHDQTEAMTMGTRIVVMKDGFIQQVDTPQTLYDDPCNVFVAGFIGSPQMNFCDAKVVKEGDGVAVEFGAGKKIALSKERAAKVIEDGYVGKVVTLGIRPEDLYDDDDSLAKYAGNIVEAYVDVTEMMGAETFLFLTIDEINMTARVKPTTKAKVGDTIKIAFDPEKIHLFDKETERVITN